MVGLFIFGFFLWWQYGIFCMKPAVYLYPTKPMVVDVKVQPFGFFTKTVPSYNGGWRVNATPEGLIDERYDYLFYEFATLDVFGSNRGWVVPKDDLASWFDRTLPLYGLNGKEAEQMKEYWVSAMDKDGYYLITPIEGDRLNLLSRLDVKPKPDTVIRVYFNFKHINKPVDVAKPVIRTPERKGFTVVEWGGVLSQ